MTLTQPTRSTSDWLRLHNATNAKLMQEIEDMRTAERRERKRERDRKYRQRRKEG